MKLVELGEVAEFTNGAAFKPADWHDSGRRIIRIQNLTDPSKAFNRTERKVPAKYEVPPGALLVSWSASLGVFEWRGPDTGLLNQHIFKVTPNASVRQDYLRHILRKALRDMAKYAHGSTMLHVNRGEFLSTQIPVPSLHEQQRIAGILDQAEALCRKRQDALRAGRRLAGAAFQTMFGDWCRPGDGAGLTPLGDKLSFLTSGSRGWAQYYSDSGAAFIRIQNVRRDELILSDLMYVRAPGNAEAERTRVRPGDVLLSITADLGRTAVVPQGLGVGYINQHLAILRTEQLAPRFLSAALSSPAGQRMIIGRNRGGVKAGLNFDDIRSFTVPNVSRAVQDRFAAVAARADSTVRQLASASQECERLFASVQQRAFSGELSRTAAPKMLEHT